MFYNAEVSARRFPNKPFLVYYDTTVSFAEFHDEAERVAGFLEQRCGVRKGDRVLLLMQNSPQFMIGYYGILRANAVVVPLNPMNLTQEILRYAQDAGANTLLVSQELYPRVEPLLKSQDLKHVIVAAYSDYLKVADDLGRAGVHCRPAHRLSGARVVPVEGCARRRLEARPADRGSGRSVRDAVYLRYDGAAQGLHAHASHRHAHRGGRHAVVFAAARTDAAGGGADVSCDRHARRH